jgi:hypothetical protein
MKIKKSYILLVVLCLPMLVPGQKKDSVRYGGIQQFNFTFAESGPAVGLTLVNGVRFHRFFVGAGVDYHTGNRYYYWPDATAAIYLDGRYYMSRARNFFVKLDAGVNLVAGGRSSWYASEFNKKPGYYGGVGVGFKARVGKELFYVFDVSYVMRQTRYDIKYQDWRMPSEWLTDKYDHRIPMIVVSMGLEIF